MKKVVATGILVMFMLAICLAVTSGKGVNADDEAEAENRAEEALEPESEELPEVGLPSMIEHYAVLTSVSNAVGYYESNIFYFSDAAVTFWMAIRTDENGVVNTVEFSSFMGYPTVINYSNDEADFVMPADEPVCKITLAEKELKLNEDQLNLLTKIFSSNTDYIAEAEIGRFGYYEDGVIDLTSYLEDSGLEPDNDGIYWTSPEDNQMREGFKLAMATTSTDEEPEDDTDDVTEEGPIDYLQPTFYGHTLKYEASIDDYETIDKEWTPEKGECTYNAGQKLVKVELNGQYGYANYSVLEGIMQCIERGDLRNGYCYLDPAHEAISRNTTLYYNKVYD